MYDTSIKVPTAVWWPARIKKGIRISETVSNLDWYPTILDIAGIAQPKNTVIRGRSFLPLLLGDSVPNWDNDLYAEYSTKHQSHTHMRMYRTPEWKLVRDFMNPDRDELFDLVNDPMETTNLLSGSKGIATESIFQDFSRRIYQQMETIGDIVVNASLTDMLKQ
jgi:choline-sulfatase